MLRPCICLNGKTMCPIYITHFSYGYTKMRMYKVSIKGSQIVFFCDARALKVISVQFIRAHNTGITTLLFTIGVCGFF